MPEADKRSHHAILRSIADRVMLQRGLLPAFQALDLAELELIEHAVTRTDTPTRDLRKLCWCSIDHNDTQSLDQLTYAERLPQGEIKVLVAIADVEAMVKKHTALDAHARHNTCTVYTSVELYPMLPNKLANDLTSLSRDQERLAVVVDMIIARDGSIMGSNIYSALVRNWAKLHYNSLAKWLEGETPLPQVVKMVKGLEANLRLQDNVAAKMNSIRHEYGALDYQTLQARPVFKKEDLQDLTADAPNRARDIVTELMIAANGVVAKFLGEQGFPSFRRIVKTPKRWDRIREIAAEHGVILPEEPDPKALNHFLQTQRLSHPAKFADLSYTITKLLGSGEYTVETPGIKSAVNFGLAVKDYTHSTAPNRRYPDLVTQRLIKASLARHPVPYQNTELEELAKHCTEIEDTVKKVERQISKSVSAMHLKSRIGEQFEAIVTGASEKGTWVRIMHPPVEGKLTDGTKGLDVGHKLRVQLVNTDVENGFIDFAVV